MPAMCKNMMLINNTTHIAFVKQKLCETFLMTDLGPLRYFLGIEITSYSDGYRLSQQRYTLDLLARSGLTDTRTAATPMELHLQLRASDGVPLSDPSRYRHLVGIWFTWQLLVPTSHMLFIFSASLLVLLHLFTMLISFGF